MAGILKCDQVQSDSNLSFQVAGANVAYMNSTGLQMTGGQIIAGSNTLLTASGLIYANAGIKFPTSQNASADANTLDDYEEGTWTPGLSFDNGTTGITYATQSGAYTKIGSQVTIWAYVQLSNKGSSTGAARITGFPFQNINAPGRSEGASVVFNYWTNMVSTPIPLGYVQNNATTAYLVNGVGANTIGTLTDANFTNTTALYFCATYSIV